MRWITSGIGGERKSKRDTELSSSQIEIQDIQNGTSQQKQANEERELSSGTPVFQFGHVEDGDQGATQLEYAIPLQIVHGPGDRFARGANAISNLNMGHWHAEAEAASRLLSCVAPFQKKSSQSGLNRIGQTHGAQSGRTSKTFFAQFTCGTLRCGGMP